MNKIKVAVIGASGYAGLELVRLLARHPGCELAAVTSLEYPGRPFSQIFPALAGIVDLSFMPDPAPEKIGAAASLLSADARTGWGAKWPSRLHSRAAPTLGARASFAGALGYG